MWLEGTYKCDMYCVCSSLSSMYRRTEWCHLEAVVTDENTITVRNAKNDSKEYLGIIILSHIIIPKFPFL